MAVAIIPPSVASPARLLKTLNNLVACQHLKILINRSLANRCAEMVEAIVNIPRREMPLRLPQQGQNCPPLPTQTQIFLLAKAQSIV